MLLAVLGLVWSRTDLFGHNYVILGPHMHAPPLGIKEEFRKSTFLNRPMRGVLVCKSDL